MTSPERPTQSDWVVAVRLSDGSLRYYAQHAGRQGQHEWSPRVTQAHHFQDRDDAITFAASCTVAGDAREYIAVPAHP